MAAQERAGIKRIAQEIKDVDRGCSGNIYTIDVYMYIYLSIYICAMHRHYRLKSKATDRAPQNFYSESIFRDTRSN